MLTALVASIAILTHPTGQAAASTSSPLPSVSIVHGCDTGDGLGDWVEATLHSNAQIIDPSDPAIVQVGLAVSKQNDDTYIDDAGPVLLKFTGKSETVGLTGPIRGAHVFVRQYDGTAFVNTPVPAVCRHVARTDFGLARPAIISSGTSASCVSSDATLKVTLWNDGDVDTDYTVLLVRGETGELVGSNPQGQLVPVPAHSQTTVVVAQPYQTTKTIYQFQVRALGLDGTGVTGGNRPVQCDSQGHKGPRPSLSPVRPSQSPASSSSAPSSASSHPSSSSAPSKTAPHSTPVSSSAPRSSGASRVTPKPSASTTAVSTPTGQVSNGNGSGSNDAGNGGTNNGGVQSSADTGGAVLGDADSTRQPGKPSASSTPAAKKQFIIGAARVTPGVSGGIAAGVALILLVFAGAIAGMVVANRASARRR